MGLEHNILRRWANRPYFKVEIASMVLGHLGFLCTLTPKERSLVFGPFLKFGHAIVDAIFVQKISNF
jgi:hypothetical protein